MNSNLATAIRTIVVLLMAFIIVAVIDLVVVVALSVAFSGAVLSKVTI